MKDFKDKVAVITGGANGIGRGIANIAAKEGMKIVLADIEADALSKAEEELKSAGATVLSVLTDVSKDEDVGVLAQKTVDTFGKIHLLFYQLTLTYFSRNRRKYVYICKYTICNE